MVVFGVDVKERLKELIGDKEFSRLLRLNPEKREEYARKFLGISRKKQKMCCKSGSDHRA